MDVSITLKIINPSVFYDSFVYYKVYLEWKNNIFKIIVLNLKL